jgi:hypothetical protein
MLGGGLGVAAEGRCRKSSLRVRLHASQSRPLKACFLGGTIRVGNDRHGRNAPVQRLEAELRPLSTLRRHPSRMTTLGSQPGRGANPSPWWTWASYSLPVSPAHRNS